MKLHRESGAVLVVGLIMLVLVSLALTSAWMLSSSNARATGNLQSRNEAISAGKLALEQVVSSPFFETPAEETIQVDLDADGTADYEVRVAEPECRSSVAIANTEVPPSSITLGGAFASASSGQFYTEWGLRAEVEDLRGSGASVVIEEGVLTTLTETQANAGCL